MIGSRLRSPLIRLGVSRAATALTASVAARVAAARRFSSVVDSAWVRAGGEGGEKLLLLDCEQETAFRRAHIPGALPFLVAPSGLKNPTPSTTGLITEEQFESIIEGLQLDADATLVFYDDDASMKAIRMWWVFHHFGFPKEQLKVLDGGWKQWVADSSPVETALPTAFPAATTPWSFKATTNALVGLDEVKQGIESGVQFVDARSPAEYTGANPAGNARGGHVPGAINFNWVNAVDLASTGRFKSKSELESVLVGELGLDKKKPVITYCQRGIRAAHTAFVLQEVAGFEDVKVYEDSMLQYLNRDDTAVEK